MWETDSRCTTENPSVLGTVLLHIWNLSRRGKILTQHEQGNYPVLFPSVLSHSHLSSSPRLSWQTSSFLPSRPPPLSSQNNAVSEEFISHRNYPHFRIFISLQEDKKQTAKETGRKEWPDPHCKVRHTFTIKLVTEKLTVNMSLGWHCLHSLISSLLSPSVPLSLRWLPTGQTYWDIWQGLPNEE